MMKQKVVTPKIIELETVLHTHHKDRLDIPIGHLGVHNPLERLLKVLNILNVFHQFKKCLSRSSFQRSLGAVFEDLLTSCDYYQYSQQAK